MRIKDILGEDACATLEESFTLSYSWNNGYERLVIKFDGGGELNFAGAYHPNVVCEPADAPCQYCGYHGHCLN